MSGFRSVCFWASPHKLGHSTQAKSGGKQRPTHRRSQALGCLITDRNQAKRPTVFRNSSKFLRNTGPPPFAGCLVKSSYRCPHLVRYSTEMLPIERIGRSGNSRRNASNTGRLLRISASVGFRLVNVLLVLCG